METNLPAVSAPSALAAADLLWDPAAFEHSQRIARMFASSDLIPAHLRGKLADVTIALLMAKRLGEDPLMVMQSIYVVSGRAGWGATYMIARAIRSGVFKGRLNWKIEGKGDALTVTCFATLADTEEVVAATASMQMAKAEQWTKNPKYTSMPEQMLRYRSATMLIRLYAPDVMFGLPTIEEVEDTHAAGGFTVEQAPRSARTSVRERLKIEPEVAQLPEPPIEAAGPTIDHVEREEAVLTPAPASDPTPDDDGII